MKVRIVTLMTIIHIIRIIQCIRRFSKRKRVNSKRPNQFTNIVLRNMLFVFEFHIIKRTNNL